MGNTQTLDSTVKNILDKNTAREYSNTTRREAFPAMKRLKKDEWQRWIPVLNFYKNAKYINNYDSFLLCKMHSLSYNIVNIVYTSTTTGAILGNLFDNAIKQLF